MQSERYNIAVDISEQGGGCFNLLSPQMKEILTQVSEEPFLVNLLPHLVKFVESKSMVLMTAEEPGVGDVAVFSLLLQVL